MNGFISQFFKSDVTYAKGLSDAAAAYSVADKAANDADITADIAYNAAYKSAIEIGLSEADAREDADTAYDIAYDAAYGAIEIAYREADAVYNSVYNAFKRAYNTAIEKKNPTMKSENELKLIAKYVYESTVTNSEQAINSYYLTREVRGHFEDKYYFDEYTHLSDEEQEIVLKEFDALLMDEYFSK